MGEGQESTLNILIPTDFSEESELAINSALSIGEKAIQSGTYSKVAYGMVHVLPVNTVSHVISEGMYTDSTTFQSGVLVDLQNQAKQQISTQAERFQIPLSHSLVLMGSISSTIVDYAEEMKVDLIVMGTQRQKSILSWLSGSEGTIVACQSRIPVLSVTEEYGIEELDKMLYIHDLDRHNLISAPRFLINLVKMYGAEMELLFLSHKLSEEKALQMSGDYKKKHGLGQMQSEILLENNINQALKNFDKAEFDVIAMGTHGRGILSQLFRRSIAEKMIENADKIVLTFRLS